MPRLVRNGAHLSAPPPPPRSPPPAAAVAVAVATVGPESFATQLRGLAEMKAQGLLTDEEFAAAKMKLLSP